MDFLKELTEKRDGGAAGQNTVARPADTQSTQQNSGGGLFGSLQSTMNEALGGGAKSEAREDGLDKAVDWVQENVLKEGPQNNESALEQMKDEQISDAIRRTFKSTTGRDFPIKDTN